MGRFLPAGMAIAFAFRVADTPMKRLRVKINLERLRQHLAKEDRTNVSLDDVHRWLKEARFEQDGDSYIVRELDLGQLKPDEVTEVEDYDESADEPPSALTPPPAARTLPRTY
jgi:hypothetical protein